MKKHLLATLYTIAVLIFIVFLVKYTIETHGLIIKWFFVLIGTGAFVAVIYCFILDLIEGNFR